MNFFQLLFLCILYLLAAQLAATNAFFSYIWGQAFIQTRQKNPSTYMEMWWLAGQVYLFMAISFVCTVGPFFVPMLYGQWIMRKD